MAQRHLVARRQFGAIQRLPPRQWRACYCHAGAWSNAAAPLLRQLRIGALATLSLTTIMLVSSSGLAAAAPSWALQSAPRPGGSQTTEFRAVSCPTATFCAAVGSWKDSSKVYETLAETWDARAAAPGSTWRITPSPSLAGDGDRPLDAIDCLSSKFCLAVGSQVSASAVHLPLAETWNGTSWSLDTPLVPSGSKVTGFDGVSCTSTTHCVVVGDYKNSSGRYSLIETLNGSTWTINSSKSPTGSLFVTLYSVSCATTTSCMAVGVYDDNQDIQYSWSEQLSGTTWTERSMPTTGFYDNIDAVTCLSGMFCVAAGYFAPNDTYDNPLVEVWNGTSWGLNYVPAPGWASALDGIDCFTTAYCIGAGDVQPAKASQDRRPFIVTLQSSLWTQATVPAPSGATSEALEGISCSSSTPTCTGVGWYTSSNVTFPLVAHT